MKRLLAALLLVAAPALAQSNGWREAANGWGEIQTPAGYSAIPAPTGCASGLVPYFNASLQLVCSPTVYAPATDTTTSTGTIAARNLTATALATPTITPPLVVSGTPGATTYGYKVVALLADGTSTAASAEVTIATGNATLDATNYISGTFAVVTGAVSYKVYRTTGGAAPPKLISTQTGLNFTDTGLAGTAQTPATDNTTGRVLAGNGSATTPGFAFTSDSRYGMSLVGSGLNFSTSDGKVAILSSSGLQLSASALVLGDGTANIIAPAAATLQLGAANAAAPVGQRLRSQGAATGTDIAGADLSISPGPMTGTGANYAAGRYGALRLGTYVPGTTGTTTSTTTTDRLVIPGRPIVLTAGSATNIVHIDIPALAGASWDITYSVNVTDSAAPVHMKVLGGRYYGSAYRLAAGNAVPNAVAETGDNEVHSVGGAASDVMTFTGDATGIMVAHNITVGTGLTAPNTVIGSYMITVSGAAAITVTPQ